MSNTKYTISINDTEVERIKSFTAEKNLTQYSGKFDMLVSDPENMLYDTVTSGDEITAVRAEDSKKVFGGYLEKIERVKDSKYLLSINGGDYTTTLNDIIVLAQIYNHREYSVIIRDLMYKWVMSTTLLDNCDSTDGWSETGATLSLEDGEDTNGNPISRLGDACLKLEPTATTIALEKTFASPQTYTLTDYVTMYVYIENSSKVSEFSIDVGQDSSNYYSISAPRDTLVDGWNYVEFDMASATTGAGSPALTNVDYFNLNFTLTDTTNEIMLDEIRKISHTDADFTLSNVSTTTYYTDIKFKNVTVFDCIRKICDIRPNTFDFYIDIDKVLNFGIFGSIDSGEILQRGVNVLKSEFWDDDTKLVNKVTVYGAKQEFNLTQTFDGDGTTKEFELTYEPITQTVSVGGTEKQGYVQGMSPTEYDYRVDKENRLIQFTNAPGAGSDNISVDFTYGIPIIVQKQDDVSIANYGLREQKIENEHLLTKDDVRIVSQEYIDTWKDPILNAKYSIRVNPNFDIGENVSVIDEKYFGDSVLRNFGVVSLKHTLIGGRAGTELSLTQITKSVEDYLQDIFTRLTAIEEKDKGDRDVLARLLSFSDDFDFQDDPENNLSITARSIGGDVLIWGNPYFGIWGTNKWGTTANTSFILGNELAAIIGVTPLGTQTSEYGDNLVVNPSN
jgi:hypothetical protein